MKVKLARGRSKASWLVLAGKSLHVFVWVPALGADSTGMTLRWRTSKGWTHTRLILFQRNAPRTDRLEQMSRRYGGKIRVRRTLTIAEATMWQTAPGVKDRVGTKGYVRLKASLPVRQTEKQPVSGKGPYTIVPEVETQNG